MWRDENGFKHNGPSPYEQRKLAKLRSMMTIEEKYKEKVEDVCRWLNNLLYLDTNTGNIRILNPDYHNKKEIIEEFRKMMQLD
jgi:hypothetical protein